MLEAARSAARMLDELRSAEDWLEPFFDDEESTLAAYTGPGWRKDSSSEVYDPENFALEWMSLMAPQCAMGNPRIRVKSSRRGSAQDRGKGLELAGNRWIKATNARALHEKLIADYGFHWGVVLVEPAEEGVELREREDPRGWPVSRRVSPRRFIWDVWATEKELTRWRGHKAERDKDDMLRRAEENPDEGWDVEAIQALTEGQGIDEMRASGKSEAMPERGVVVIYNVWMAEYEPTPEDRKFHGDDAWDRPGVHGAWLTVGLCTDDSGQQDHGKWLRRPYPYWGRRKGPYSWEGTLMVPDECAMLGPIPAVRGQDDEYNDHQRALSKAMAVYKKGILVDATDPDWEDKIREFEDHFVVALEGLDNIRDKVQEIELGGATELHMAHSELLRQRRNRVSGITDTMRGSLTPGATATAEAVADEKSDTRIGWVIHKFRTLVADYLESVLWYLDKDERVTMDFGQEADGLVLDPETGEPIEFAVWQGGLDEDDNADEDTWDALGFEIEPYSMEQTSEALQQRRMIEMMNVLGFLVPMMAQYPFVRWDELVETLGETMNITSLGDYFDMDVLEEFRTLMLQAQLEPAQGGSTKPQPRIGMDKAPWGKSSGGLGQALMGRSTGSTAGGGSAA